LLQLVEKSKKEAKLEDQRRKKIESEARIKRRSEERAKLDARRMAKLDWERKTGTIAEAEMKSKTQKQGSDRKGGEMPTPPDLVSALCAYNIFISSSLKQTFFIDVFYHQNGNDIPGCTTKAPPCEGVGNSHFHNSRGVHE
jgi:hypothetical protein